MRLFWIILISTFNAGLSDIRANQSNISSELIGGSADKPHQKVGFTYYSNNETILNYEHSTNKTEYIPKCKKELLKESCIDVCGCLHGGNCSSLTGKCTCPIGWSGEKCDLPCTCSNNGNCDTKTGICSCLNGYRGVKCENKCASETYGMDCNNKCECLHFDSCSHIDGTCDCKAGWNGEKCDLKCNQNFFGKNCLKPCNCSNNGICHPENGVCECNSGFLGSHCAEICQMGYYGLDCKEKCYCNNHSNECNPSNGICKCPSGFNGNKCENCCELGYFGLNCANKCICNNNNSNCNASTGNCDCYAGWIGAECNSKCSDGFYGNNCSESCNCSYICDHKKGCLTFFESGLILIPKYQLYIIITVGIIIFIIIILVYNNYRKKVKYLRNKVSILYDRIGRNRISKTNPVPIQLSTLNRTSVRNNYTPVPTNSKANKENEKNNMETVNLEADEETEFCEVEIGLDGNQGYTAVVLGTSRERIYDHLDFSLPSIPPDYSLKSWNTQHL